MKLTKEMQSQIQALQHQKRITKCAKKKKHLQEEINKVLKND